LSVTADYWGEREIQSCGYPKSTLPNAFLAVLLHADHMWNLWALELAMALISTANNPECVGLPVCIDHAASSDEYGNTIDYLISRTSSKPHRTCLISIPSNLVLGWSCRIRRRFGEPNYDTGHELESPF
jgi:hypothetical protein